MKKVLLFGATGNLGKEIAKEAIKQGYDLTAVVRNRAKAEQLSKITTNYLITDITNKNALENICKGFDIVISALGKSVSPNDHSKPTFNEIDLVANTNILLEAQRSGIKKFIYVSALHAEKYPELEYFRVHHQFSELLKQSGINYAIIKPPAIFSAFIDMVDMATKGLLVNMGSGNKQTNPIFEGDLAKICVDSINKTNAVIEAGGKSIYTRKQLNEIIQKTVNPNKSVKNIPLGFVKFSLPLMRLFNKNMFDKFAFFVEVMQHDTIASQVGEMRFEDYIKSKI